MDAVGTPEHPLRVAIIGAGPAGFYAADHLLKQKELVIDVDLFDRLPTPFGLVRGGVAPDHQKIKSVTKAFDKVAAHPRFRFYGNIEYGTHLTLPDLQQHYHQVVFTTGAQTDRSMGIPGEDLLGSHSATEFVAWYNGHPDYCHLQFDLSAERVAVIGVGNVAVDVARILCLTPDELAATDMADYAVEALRESRVREVHMFGRRGPAQAAFTNPELKELCEMQDADLIIRPEEAALDELSRAMLEREPDRLTVKKIEVLQEQARREPEGRSKQLYLRFLVSPVEILGDEEGRVASLRLVRNVLCEDGKGGLRPRHTEAFEDLPVGLVFRSVGYLGVPLPALPFHERWGVIPNERGRVVDPARQTPVRGLYVAGWIKRGPTGVIGTNKPDAVETVTCMLEDLSAGLLLAPPAPDARDAETLIRQRQPHHFTYADWQRLDALETTRGEPVGRPRVKLTSREDMLAALKGD